MKGSCTVAMACFCLAAGVASGLPISEGSAGSAPLSAERCYDRQIAGASAPVMAQAVEGEKRAVARGKNSENKGDHIVVMPGEEFTVCQDSNPSTGYQWQLVEPGNEAVVKVVNKEFVSPAKRLPGSGGKDVWTFKAVGRGTTRIVLRYVRPWEKGTPPAKEVTYTVEVQ